MMYYYKRGKLICVKKPFCEVTEVPPGSVEEVIFDEDGYNLHWQAYTTEKIKLEEEFKRDLIESSGLHDAEIAEKCFSMAWDYGCSGGLKEVHEYFDELIQLTK